MLAGLRRAFWIVVPGLLLWPGAAPAATFKTACSGTTGNPASLVSAIVQANSSFGADTVQLGSHCVYTLTAANNNWYGPNGLPEIKSDITIEGHGATIVRASEAAKFRLFFVGADPANPDTDNYTSPGPGRLTLRSVALTGGLAKGGDADNGGGGAGMGGAIFSQGSVVIDGSTLTGNTAQGGASGVASLGTGGGGIGTDALPGMSTGGGGFGSGSFGGASGGSSGGSGAGGAGFRITENGNPPAGSTPGAGGGPRTGTGGFGGNGGAASGDGSGGGGKLSGGSSGGGFGFGGGFFSGGGVGGGGGGGGLDEVGGGGGFGAGGGGWVADGGHGNGGGGGFGGGGAANGGPPGVGGGSPTADAGGGGAGMGGAIFNMQGTLTIRNSTVAGNTALGGADNVTDHGKGIAGAVFNMSGTFTATGSTFAGNTAAYFASQIYNIVYDGDQARTAQTTLRGSIVSDGVGSATWPYDLASDKTPYNLPAELGNANADLSHADLVRTMKAEDEGTVIGSPRTADPRLGPLQQNGGPTATMALAPVSPAIDAVPATAGACLPVDQRGFPRRDNREARCDIGAVERQDVPDTGITAASIKRRKHSARFSFRAFAHATGFECARVKKRRHHKKAKPVFSRCSSPKSYKNLGRGKYTFEVRALSAAGRDATPASKSFKI